ncbi:MAG: hypothetical protein J2P49_08400 [Methylocapsa sp.]|nr:hypothetical protein [Methylocapsa sp.]
MSAVWTPAASHASRRERSETQKNLGNALSSLGERESGTARLEEAVSAYRNALKEWTQERVALDAAMSTGNQGVAMMLLAERKNDPAMAGEALKQIEEAFQLTRTGRSCAECRFLPSPPDRGPRSPR